MESKSVNKETLLAIIGAERLRHELSTRHFIESPCENCGKMLVVGGAPGHSILACLGARIAFGAVLGFRRLSRR